MSCRWLPGSNPGARNIDRVLVTKGKWGLQLDAGRVGALVYTGSTVYIYTPQAIAVDAWTHVALTYRKDDKLRLYVNGSEVVSADTANFLDSSTQAVTVGSTNGAGDPAGSGPMDMDDIRIYGRQISPEEVAGLAGVSAQAYWRLDNDLTDSSGNGHTLSVLGQGRSSARSTRPRRTRTLTRCSSMASFRTSTPRWIPRRRVTRCRCGSRPAGRMSASIP